MRRDRDRRPRFSAVPAVVLACLMGAVPLLYAVLAARGEADPQTAAPLRAIASPSVFAPMSKAPQSPLLDQPRAPLRTAELDLSRSARSTRVPRSFLGLSLEYWSLEEFLSGQSDVPEALALMQPVGDGPELLRIGGDSADHVYWHVATRAGLDDVHPGLGFLRRLSALVRVAHLRVMLDLNLAAGLPSMAAAWARAASQTLPRGSLAALEIGNEPDLYHRQPFYRLAAPRRSPLRLLSAWRAYGLGSYEAGFAAYTKALARATGRLPIAGPAVASPMADPGWIARMIRDEHGRLGMVSAHFYPFAACRPPTSAMYPTIPRLLGPTTSNDIVGPIARAAAEAHRAGLPFRLTEFNSVSCGGRRRVSDTFATALWAPDALFGLLRAGVDGVNLHIRAHGINAPFILDRQGIEARPLLYGLAAFAQTLGPDARLLPTQLRAQSGLRLSAWSVRIRGDILHVLLTNKGDRGALVNLRLPASAPMTVRRLAAPSVTASTGVSLGGRWIDQNARWSGPLLTTIVRPSPRGYGLALPGHSAALLAVSLARAH